MPSFRKRLDRWTRDRSTRYAHCAQCNVFAMYITKFINKYLKLHTPNPHEHPELFEQMSTSYAVKHMVNVIHLNKHKLIDLLITEYCLNRPLKSTHQRTFTMYANLRVAFDERVLNLARTVVNDRQSKVDEYVTSVCAFASALRDGFVYSDATAKSKVAEHWFQRLPLVVSVSCMSMCIKCYLEFTRDVDQRAYIEIVSHGVMCMTAIWLVYLRVPQAIFADAKKSASELYISHKTKLYQQLTFT